MDEPTLPPVGRPGAGAALGPGDRRLSPGAVAFLGLGMSIGLCLAVTVGVLCTGSTPSPTTRRFPAGGLASGSWWPWLWPSPTIRKYL